MSEKMREALEAALPYVEECAEEHLNVGYKNTPPIKALECKPDCWKRSRISNGEVEYFTERDWKHENLFVWAPCYSRETVESLLEAQVLSLLKEHELRMGGWRV